MSEREQREPNKSKRNEAARKAWETIRKQKREAGARISKRLDEFITVKRIASIPHPEAQQLAIGGYGVIVREFDKTPPDIVCGKFWELRWAYGCPLNCAYCYLRGTTRGYMTPRPVKLNHVLKELDEVFNDPIFNGGNSAIFNSGELCDSLMFPRIMSKIADKFEEQDKHKLLTLTKFGLENARFLIDRPRRNTICAWSINAVEVAKRWESAAPHPMDRIRAASAVHEAGYQVRVRIDPIFPVEDWRIHYGDLAEKILATFNPTRIILGTPRGLWKTITYAKKAGIDMSWSRYFEDTETGWGKKLPHQLRKEVYELLYDRLSALGYDRSRISICKETGEMFDTLGMRYDPSTCQCYSS